MNYCVFLSHRNSWHQRPRRLPREYPVNPGKLMMPPADRIQLEQDPGHVASKKGQDERPKDFQAVGPALRILQLDQYLRFVSIQASRFQQARRQTQRRCGVSTA